MQRLILVLGGVGLTLACTVSPAPAQFGNSGFNTSQQGSSSGFGSTSGLGGGVTAGQRSFSGSGSNNQLGTGTSQDQSGQSTLLQGNERFVRGNRQGAFVGADSGDAGNPYSQTGQNGQGMNGQSGLNGRGGLGSGGLNGQNRQGLNNQFNQYNQNQQGFGQNGATTKTQVRATLVVGFTPPRTNAAVIGTRLESQLAKTRGLDRLSPLSVSVQGRTVVLRGTVRSEHDRELAEQLALLEPGVAAVQNELQVPLAAPADTD